MIPYILWQNNVAKRKNKTIQKMTMCMLENLPNFLWDEALSTAIYTLNRYPTKIVEDKTPYEACT